MATVTILGSEHVRSSHKGGMARSKVPDLLHRAAAGGVANGPSGLLLDVKLGLGEQVHEGGDDVGVNHGLDLLLVPCGDMLIVQHDSFLMLFLL